MRTINTPLEPQCFRDGYVKFYQTKNTAQPGDMPKEQLVEMFGCPYENRKISDSRYYAAMQAGTEMSKVLRCPKIAGLQPAGDVAILTGDANQYRVEKVSNASTTNPESMDVTLSVAKTIYTIAEEGEEDDG